MLAFADNIAFAPTDGSTPSSMQISTAGSERQAAVAHADSSDHEIDEPVRAIVGSLATDETAGEMAPTSFAVDRSR